MTTKELFDEYANIIYNLRVDPKYHYCATGRTLEGIIQEVEALVRKETIEDILNVIQEEGSNCLQKPYNIHRNRLKTLAFYY